jgi:hypothetical protein
MAFRLYIVRRSRTVTFLATVRVPSLLDALHATDAYRARLRAGDRFKITVAK